MVSPHGAGLPARLNPDWCRFLTGCLVGEVRAEAEGVPPRDMENSETGPSYIPLGTALRTANYRTNRKSRDGEKKQSMAACRNRTNMQVLGETLWHFAVQQKVKRN